MKRIILYNFLSLSLVQTLYCKEESLRNRRHEMLMNVNCTMNNTCYCSPVYNSSHTNPYVVSSVRIPQKYRPLCPDCGGRKQRKRMTLEEVEDAQLAINTDNLKNSQKKIDKSESEFEQDIDEQDKDHHFVE